MNGVQTKKAGKYFYLIYGIVVVVLLCADQGTKWLIQQMLRPGESHSFLPYVAQLTYVQNTGVAFGAFAGKVNMITIVSALLMIALVAFIVIKCPRSHMIWLSIAAIVAGGIGNMVDRIRLNYVVDFIDLLFMNFPVFNVADMWVVGGTILLVIYILFFEEKQSGKEKNLHWRRPGGRTRG